MPSTLSSGTLPKSVDARVKPAHDEEGEAVRPYTPGFGRPRLALAARTVLTKRQATVIGPTPPGTGVMAPATRAASA